MVSLPLIGGTNNSVKSRQRKSNVGSQSPCACRLLAPCTAMTNARCTNINECIQDWYSQSPCSCRLLIPCAQAAWGHGLWVGSKQSGALTLVFGAILRSHVNINVLSERQSVQDLLRSYSCTGQRSTVGIPDITYNNIVITNIAHR